MRDISDLYILPDSICLSAYYLIQLLFLCFYLFVKLCMSPLPGERERERKFSTP